MNDGAGAVLLLIFILAIYFLPSFFAIGKKHMAGIVVLNFFLGWTLLGWVAALVWAVADSNEEKKQSTWFFAPFRVRCLRADVFPGVDAGGEATVANRTELFRLLDGDAIGEPNATNEKEQELWSRIRRAQATPERWVDFKEDYREASRENVVPTLTEDPWFINDGAWQDKLNKIRAKTKHVTYTEEDGKVLFVVLCNRKVELAPEARRLFVTERIGPSGVSYAGRVIKTTLPAAAAYVYDSSKKPSNKDYEEMMRLAKSHVFVPAEREFVIGSSTDYAVAQARKTGGGNA